MKDDPSLRKEESTSFHTANPAQARMASMAAQRRLRFPAAGAVAALEVSLEEDVMVAVLVLCVMWSVLFVLFVDSLY